MLEKLAASYSKNSRNQQLFEYLLIVIIVIQIAALGNFGLFNKHPIAAINTLVNLTAFLSLVMPIFVARELWLVNRAARYFVTAAPARVPMDLRAGRIEQGILNDIHENNRITPGNGALIRISAAIDKLIQNFWESNFAYMIVFLIISLIYVYILAEFRDDVLDLIKKEPTEQSMRVFSVSEIHRSKTNLMSNLLWATLALQTVSALAIKAAYSDLRNAVEGWLTSGRVESMSPATSSPASS
jgi:hypothetical protein